MLNSCRDGNCGAVKCVHRRTFFDTITAGRTHTAVGCVNYIDSPVPRYVDDHVNGGTARLQQEAVACMLCPLGVGKTIFRLTKQDLGLSPGSKMRLARPETYSKQHLAEYMSDAGQYTSVVDQQGSAVVFAELVLLI